MAVCTLSHDTADTTSVTRERRPRELFCPPSARNVAPRPSAHARPQQTVRAAADVERESVMQLPFADGGGNRPAVRAHRACRRRADTDFGRRSITPPVRFGHASNRPAGSRRGIDCIARCPARSVRSVSPNSSTDSLHGARHERNHCRPPDPQRATRGGLRRPLGELLGWTPRGGAPYVGYRTDAGGARTLECGNEEIS